MPKVSKSILKAAAEGNEIELRNIIKHSRKIKLRDNHNWTALHHAVMSRSVPCVKLLLDETKLNPQDESHEGYTPLLLACSYQDVPIEIVELLLKKDKTLVEFMNNEMNSPLHLAVSNNRFDIVKVLVEYGADVNYTDLDFDTPLHIAASKLNYDIIEYLLYNAPCDTNLKNDFNLNPFELVVHLYEISLFNMEEQPQNDELVLKCLDLLSDFTYDDQITADSKLFELNLNNYNSLLISFVVSKYFINSTHSEAKYFMNILLNKVKLLVYPGYLLMHDSVKSINDLNFIPYEDDYIDIFNHLFRVHFYFRSEFQEIVYELLSKGDSCFEIISNSNEFVLNAFRLNQIEFDDWYDICKLLSLFNFNLNLLRYKTVESLLDLHVVRFNEICKYLKILNQFSTPVEPAKFVDIEREILQFCYAQSDNDVDRFMDIFLPIYEMQWMRLNKSLNIRFIPSLKYMAVFRIRNVVFEKYKIYSDCLKLQMLGELPLPKPLIRCLKFD